jgi:hypothetical protein
VWPERVTNGSCIFVKGDFIDLFVKKVMKKLPGTYVVITHNGDVSSPDGQTDAPSIRMGKSHVTPQLQEEYEAGRLLAWHASNLWWRSHDHIKLPPGGSGSSTNGVVGRPPYLHCLPIGLENRQWSYGSKPEVYINAMKRLVLHNNYSLPLSFLKGPGGKRRPVGNTATTTTSITTDSTEKSNSDRESTVERPLLLVAFYPKSRVPDRFGALRALKRTVPKGAMPWYTTLRAGHKQWLQAIRASKFVLAPHGHGMDTHRAIEILMMGGIPVMRRNTLSSCYDDSDNNLGVGGLLGGASNSSSSSRRSGQKKEKTRGKHGASRATGAGTGTGTGNKRGSLPVVWVDRWEDVTPEMLQVEWTRIRAVARSDWDWSRLFAEHWLARIDATRGGVGTI